VIVEDGNSKSSKLSVVMILLLALAVCLPAIVLEYGMHDDYRYFGGQKKVNLWSLHPDMRSGVVMGRPIAMFLIGGQSLLCNEIRDLVYWRFIQFGLVAACGILIYRYLSRRLLVPRFFSAVVALAVFTVPAGQLTVIWSVWSIFATPAVLLSLLGYVAFDRAYRRFGASRQWKKYALALIPAWLLLLAALYDYPATATFFLVLAAAELLFRPMAQWKETRLKMLHAVVLMCGSMGLFLLSYKFIYLPAVLAGSNRLRMTYAALDYHRISVGFDPHLFNLGVTSLFEKTLGGPLHPLLLNTATWIGGIFLTAWMVLAAGKVVADRIRCRQGTTSLASTTFPNVEGGPRLCSSQPAHWYLQAGGLLLVLAVIPAVPMLVAKGDYSNIPPLVFYRTIFVSSSVMMVLFFRGLMWIADQAGMTRRTSIRNALAAVVLAVFAGAASINMTNTALSANRELRFVRREMEKIHQKGQKAFIVRMPGYLPDYESARYPVYGQLSQPFEFDHMATNRTLIRELFQKLGKTMGMDAPEIIETNYDSDLLPAGTPVIDMREITSPARVRAAQRFDPAPPEDVGPVKGLAFSSYPVQARVTPTGEWLEIHFPSRQHWEVPRPYPHWIEFDLPPGKRLAGYSMMRSRYSDSADRMPSRWTVLVGRKDGPLRQVEMRSEPGPWEANQWKDYFLETPVEAERVRLHMEQGLNPGVLRIERFRLKLTSATPETATAP